VHQHLREFEVDVALIKLQSTRDVIRTWFFWKTQAVIVFVVIVGLVMAFSFLISAKYESSAKILVLQRSNEGIIVSANLQEPRLSPVSPEDVNTEMELLTSNEVIKQTVASFGGGGAMGLRVDESEWYDKILDNLKGAIQNILLFLKLKERLSPFDSSVQLLKDSLTVEPVIRSNIILITLRAESPKAAQVVLNRLLHVYIKHHNDVFSKREGLSFYQDQEKEYLMKLELAEAKLKAFQDKWNIVELESENQANIKLLSDLTKDLKGLEIAYDAAKIKVELLRKAISKTDKSFLVTEEMRIIPAIVELEKGLVPLLIKRSELNEIYTTSSREYQNINSQIEVLRQEIRNEVIKAVKTEELEIQALLNKMESLQSRISELRETAKKLSQNQIHINAMKREIELARKNYMLYAERTQDERIHQERISRDLANVSIANNATFPFAPVFPKRLLMLLASVMVGLFAALTIPFFLEYLDHRIKTPQEAENLLALPVICAIPEMKN